MTEPPSYRPEIRTQADLAEVWAHLMGPGGYARPSLWLLVILADHRPIPHLVEITGADEPPAENELAAFARFLRSLADDLGPGARFATLRTRPGSDTVTDLDRAWAASAYDACRRAGVRCEVPHLGTRGSIRPVPRDELVA